MRIKYVIDEENKRIGPDMLEKIFEKHGKNGHPRMIFTNDKIAFLKEHVGKDDVYGNTIKSVVAEADKWAAKDLLKYELRDGLRLLYVSHDALDTVMYCCEAYFFTGDKKYSDRVLAEFDNLLRFPDWHPYHDLDYGVLALAAGFAFDWLYGLMTPEYRAWVVSRLEELVFRPAYNDYLNKIYTKYQPGVCEAPENEFTRTYPWVQDTPGDNHKLINDAGISVCAMAICGENPETDRKCEEVLSWGYDLDKKFIRDAYDAKDGSYFEGMGYWEYGMRHLALRIAAMDTACGTHYELIDWEGFRKTIYFPVMLSSIDLHAFSFSDGSEEDTCYPPLLMLAGLYGMNGIAKLRADRIKNGGGSSFDLAWLYDGIYSSDESAEMPLDYGDVGTTNATFRTNWDKDSLFVGIHYGKNRLPHGHLDMGEFCVDYSGVRFMTDLGKDNYNIVRYGDCYRMRAEGHNCLVINPSKEPDQSWEGETYVDTFVVGEKSYCSADMSSAYPGKQVRRDLILDRKTETAEVRDVIKCEKNDNVWWFGQTQAEIEIIDGGKAAILTRNGVKMKVTSLADGLLTEMDAAPAEWSPDSPGQAVNKGYRKLALHLSGKDAYEIRITFAPEKG
ncbi:MAG: heparinase II/III family protein [Firmicutes bacterium]|nr:heparinase II/III family protein [Candidatus Colimorpha enterica]